MKTVEELRPVVTQAIRSGYRLIGKPHQSIHFMRVANLFILDTATVYKNETALGSILEEIFADPSFGIQRGDLFITSKLCKQRILCLYCQSLILSSLYSTATPRLRKMLSR